MDESPADRSVLEQIKRLFFLVPIFGTAVALTFDVGYFSGIDINLFTLFSLSEHVVFAFEVLPLVLLFTCVIFGGVIGAAVGNDLGDQAFGSFKSDSPDRVRSWFRRHRSKIPSKWTAALVLAVVLVFWRVVFPDTGIIAVSAFVVLFVIELLLIIPARHRRSRPAQLFTACLISLLAAYFLGRYLAIEYISEASVSHTIDTTDGTIQGKIIRSGDKGILFHDMKSNVTLFLKWNDIKKITATKIAGR